MERNNNIVRRSCKIIYIYIYIKWIVARRYLHSRYSGVEIDSKYYLHMEMKALREMARAKRTFVQSANRSRAPGLLIVIHFGTVQESLSTETVEHSNSKMLPTLDQAYV